MSEVQSSGTVFARAKVVGLPCFLIYCASLLSGCTAMRQRMSGSAVDEATIRRLDAAWVKAAETKRVDAWMDFYADDAVVLPPNEALATTQQAIRKSLTDMLGAPGLVLTWEPTKVEVAASGDLAYLYGAYQLKMQNEKGVPVSDYGKNVEIWKKQPNGGWKCIVDTWNSDLPPAPLPAK
jgi:ketosteroid isomerase-like protein